MNWVLVSANEYIRKENKRTMVLFCFLIQSLMFKVTVYLRFKDASSLADDLVPLGYITDTQNPILS